MNGPGSALRRLAPLLLSALLGACAHAPVSGGDPHQWTYLGNDPDGTQNIYIRELSTDKKKGTATAQFRFEFNAVHQVTDSDLKPISYVERRDLIQVDCNKQTIYLLDENYYDVDDKQVYHVKPTPGVDVAQVFAGGISDVIYQGACGKAIDWVSLGEDPQKTQDIYARVPNSGTHSRSTVKARFRFVYRSTRSLVAAPSFTKIDYVSRQAEVMMDCANQTMTLLHETYYDEDDVAVFGITPPRDARPDSVAPDSVTGIMYKAACGIPLDWTYLGIDPRNTQKVYLVGRPEHGSGDLMEAHFRFEYLAPGKLTTGADLHQVEYAARTTDMTMDCSVYS
ncbi:MAG TPA: surface-adhesin E family protein, partial [Gammaproteobacteria bacterium]|nr:surface-adhesin E family protein [Gammaproteobacteria bacterium]